MFNEKYIKFGAEVMLSYIPTSGCMGKTMTVTDQGPRWVPAVSRGRAIKVGL